MTASTPLLSLKGITKVFPGVRALENVQLDLWPGKVTALIGENGAGKSTLVKVMTGIYQCYSTNCPSRRIFSSASISIEAC